MPLNNTEKLIDYYNRMLVDAWNKNHPDQEEPLRLEKCDIDPEDLACEMIAMPKLVNRILDEVVMNMKLKVGNTVGALRFQEEFTRVIEEMRPKKID